jgi:hypothetical protein
MPLDLGEFARWLERNGVDAQFHPAYRDGAAKIIDIAAGGVVRPKHVDLAVNQAGDRGESGQQMANLQRVGEALLRFQQSLGIRQPAPTPVATPAIIRDAVLRPLGKPIAPPVAAPAPEPPPESQPNSEAGLDAAAFGLRLYTWSIAASSVIGVFARLGAGPSLSSPQVATITAVYLACAAVALYGIGRYALTNAPALGGRAPTLLATGLLAIAWVAQAVALAQFYTSPKGNTVEDSIAVAIRVAGMIALSVAASMTGRHLEAPTVVNRARLSVYLMLAGLTAVIVGVETKFALLGLLALLGGLVFHLAALDQLRAHVAWRARPDAT